MNIKHLILPTTLLLNSCGSLLNPLFDEKREFERTRDAEIGKTIEDAYKYSGFIRELDSMEKVILGEIIEYRLQTWEDCKWILQANLDDGVIFRWSYVEPYSDCGYKRFSEGPW